MIKTLLKKYARFRIRRTIKTTLNKVIKMDMLIIEYGGSSDDRRTALNSIRKWITSKINKI